jgi:hypothetical protein
MNHVTDGIAVLSSILVDLIRGSSFLQIEQQSHNACREFRNKEMKGSIAVIKETDRRKESSSTTSDETIHQLRGEPNRQIRSLRGVIDTIRHHNGETPSVDSIATHLSGIYNAQRAPALLALQQTHGNRYVQRVVAGIQAKLKVGQPGDIYEQEADRVADAVMRMPEPGVQSQTEEEELIETKPISEQITPLIQRQVEEEEEPIQAKETTCQTLYVSPNIEARINSIRGGGQPLPESTRAFFEPRFGYDFGWVRIHTGSQAMRVAKELSAEAFTCGRDIYFGPGGYSPGTSSGTRLLAHELAHVVQQQAHIQTIGEETIAGGRVDRHKGEANTNGDALLQMYPGCNNPSITGVPGTWTCDADCMINRANGTAIRRVADALLALSILQGGGSTDLYRQIQCVFACHFDTYTGYGTIASRFRAIQATLTTANYTCRPASDPMCSGRDYYGYAACPGGPVINVCPAFFALERRPFSHRVVYVIHEAAHVAGACDDVYYGTSGYPPSNEDNADSYACFVWDVAPILHGLPDLVEGGCGGRA